MNTKTDGSGLVGQQVSLLKRFAQVSHVLKGAVAFLWLPGLKQRFNGPRSIRGTRPVAVTLEVTESGGLTLAGAIAWPKDKAMKFETIFKYEFTTPMRPDAKGEVLTCKNEVIARRALALLGALVRFGEKRVYQPRAAKFSAPQHPRFLVPFNAGEVVIDEAKLTELASVDMQESLVESYRESLRQELCDSTTLPGTVLVDSAIVPDEIVEKALEQEAGYEDFSPVLGVPHWNPAINLREMPNPAEMLLNKHNVTDLESVDQQTLDYLTAEFRACCLLGERLAEDEIFDALCNPSAPVICDRGVQEIANERVVEAMRKAAGSSRAALEATSEDLLRAAQNPHDPLFLSRLSVTQIVAADSLHELPAPYAGWFLSQPDWTPPRRRVSVAAA